MAKKINISIKGKLTKPNGLVFNLKDKQTLITDFENYIKKRDLHFAGDVEITPID
jgi:hypothetical protein